MTVLVRVSIVVIKHHGQMVYLATLPHCSLPLKEVRTELELGRHLEAGTDAEGMEGGYCPPHPACSAFDREPRTIRLEVAPPTIGWASPISH